MNGCICIADVFICCQRCHHFGILKCRCMSSSFSFSIFYVYESHSLPWSLPLLIIYILMPRRKCLLLFRLLTNGMYAAVLCLHMCDVYVYHVQMNFSEQNAILLDLYALCKTNTLYNIHTICKFVFRTLSKLYLKSKPCMHMNNSFIRKSWAETLAIFHFWNTQRTGEYTVPSFVTKSLNPTWKMLQEYRQDTVDQLKMYAIC